MKNFISVILCVIFFFTSLSFTVASTNIYQTKNTFISLNSGTNHTVALKSDGTVWTWGNNQYGQLGDGTNINRSVPVRVVGIDNIEAISAGGDSTFALKNDGSVWGWGKDFFIKDLENNKIENNGSKPVELVKPNIKNKVIKIMSGLEHSLALRSDGTVLAWGQNRYGQLGKGNNDWASEELFPIVVENLEDVLDISVGYYHNAVLRKDGTVWIWGKNNLCQIGDKFDKNVLSPTKMDEISDVKKVIACGNCTCIIKNDGSLWIQGEYGFDINKGESLKIIKSFEKAVQINGVSDVVAGESGFLILKENGSVWSLNESFLSLFQDPQNIYVDSAVVPVKIDTLKDITCIAKGRAHYAALKKDGTIFTWGDNSYCQLGNGKTSRTSNSFKVEGLSNVKDVLSNLSISVAAKNDGTIFAWGALPEQDKKSYSISITEKPIQINGFEHIKQISAGTLHILGLSQDGTVWGWGVNTNGQLGIGNKTNTFIPVQLKALKDVIHVITSSDGYSLALDDKGTVWEWGNGKLMIPTEKVGLENIVDINVSNGRGVALSADGNVFDWSSTDSSPLKKLKGFENIKQISSGSQYTLGLKQDNTLWKYDEFIGMAYEVEGLDKITSISACEDIDMKDYISVLKSDGTVVDLRETDTQNPIGMYYANGLKRLPVKKLNNIIKLSNGGDHVLALKSDGTVESWGWNSYRQLGNGNAPSTVLMPAEIDSKYIELQIGNPKMIVNGVYSEIDAGNGTKPTIESGRTLVPIRAIVECLGGTITWFPESKSISISLNKKKITMQINEEKAMVDSETVLMDVSPKLINGRTMIPLRFVAENLDKDVIWDTEGKKIFICF